MNLSISSISNLKPISSVCVFVSSSVIVLETTVSNTWITSVSGLFPRIETKFSSEPRQQLCLNPWWQLFCPASFSTDLHEGLVLLLGLWLLFLSLLTEMTYFMKMTPSTADVDDSESTARLSSEGLSLSSLSLRDDDDGYPQQQLVSFSLSLSFSVTDTLI